MVIRGRERRGWLGIVLGAPNARQLAYFYRDLLGWELATDEPDWCTIGMPDAPVNLGSRPRSTTSGRSGRAAPVSSRCSSTSTFR